MEFLNESFMDAYEMSKGINEDQQIENIRQIMKEHAQQMQETIEMPEVPETAEVFEPTEFIETEEGGETVEVTEFTEIIGNPEEDMEAWSPQTEDYSCAVACQKYIAEQLTNVEFTEKSMIEYAYSEGWYDPESGGTPFDDTGNLLEEVGLDVDRDYGGTLQEIAQSLENGDKVICAVNNTTLQCPEYADIPGVTANHAVEVIGIGMTKEGDLKVILNDPGIENGCGFTCDAETFMKAWGTGGNFITTVSSGEQIV
ncbi:MAG: hypothetical protein ACI4A5_04095 [Hominilimicola sp.]